MTSKFSKLQKFQDYLSNRGYTSRDWENIVDLYGEYLMEDSDFYVFKHHFGLGKTTLGLMLLEQGDIFLQETYDQLKGNVEHFKALRPQDDIRIIFGWDTFIGLDKNTDKFQKLTKLQKDHPQRINKLQQLTRKHNGKYARMKIRVDEDKTPVLDEYADQFNASTWKNNIIFACSKKIELIEQKTFLKSANSIVIDEGVEFTFSSDEIKEIQKALLDLGQRNPSGITLYNQNTPAKQGIHTSKREHLRKETQKKLVQAKNLNELIQNSPSFINWKWSEKLSDTELQELGKLGRESLLGVIHGGYSEKISEGNDRVKLVHSERGPHIHTTDYGLGNFNPLKEFSKKWRKVAKKKEGGINLKQFNQIKTDHYPGDYSKFEKELWIQALQNNWNKVKQLQRFYKIAEFIHNIENLNVMLHPDQNTQEIDKIRYDTPLMFKLFDINENNDQEILILDATTDEYYLEWIKRRWKNYYRDTNNRLPVYPHKKKIRFLGQDRSYISLPHNKAADQVRRYYWDFNREKETITRSLARNNFRKFNLLVNLIERDNNQDTALVSTKEFRKTFNTDGKVEKASHFAVATGQNWNSIEKKYIFGKPTKPWYVYEEEFMKQYREYQPFNPEKFKRGKGRDEILEPEEWIVEGLISGHVTQFFHRRERKIYNYWRRNLQKPVFDSYFRMRGGEKLNIVGFDRFNWVDKYGTGENHYPVSHLFAELMDERYLIENWEKVKEVLPNRFFKEHFPHIVTKKGKLRKPFRMYKKWIKQGFEVEKELRNLKGTKTSYYDWKKEYKKYNLLDLDLE